MAIIREWCITGEGMIDFRLIDTDGEEHFVLASALYDPATEEWDTESDGCFVPPDYLLPNPPKRVRDEALKIRDGWLDGGH